MILTVGALRHALAEYHESDLVVGIDFEGGLGVVYVTKENVSNEGCRVVIRIED